MWTRNQEDVAQSRGSINHQCGMWHGTVHSMHYTAELKAIPISYCLVGRTYDSYIYGKNTAIVCNKTK